MRRLNQGVGRLLKKAGVRTVSGTARFLDGKTVVGSAAFRENRLAFGTAYGLAAQGLGLAEMKTTLMPKQILMDRLIASKRPMTVAALLLLLTMAFVGYAGNVFTWNSYADSVYESALRSADQASSSSQSAKSAVQQAEQDRDAAVQEQQIFLRVAHRRFETRKALGLGGEQSAELRFEFLPGARCRQRARAHVILRRVGRTSCQPPPREGRG